MKKFPSIKKNSDFRAAYKNGKGRTSGPISMYVTENGTKSNRIGISISRREGNSVVRHTFSRRIREIFKIYDTSTVQGKDIVITARNGAGSASFDSLRENYRRLLSFHNIYDESK